MLFISSCLISKAGTSKNVTSRTDSEHACLVSDFTGNAFTHVTYLQIVSVNILVFRMFILFPCSLYVLFHSIPFSQVRLPNFVKCLFAIC